MEELESERIAGERRVINARAIGKGQEISSGTSIEHSYRCPMKGK